MNIFRQIYNYFKVLVCNWDVSRLEEVAKDLYKEAQKHPENKNSLIIIRAGVYEFTSDLRDYDHYGYYTWIFQHYGIALNRDVDIDYIYQLFVKEYDSK